MKENSNPLSTEELHREAKRFGGQTDLTEWESGYRLGNAVILFNISRRGNEWGPVEQAAGQICGGPVRIKKEKNTP